MRDPEIILISLTSFFVALAAGLVFSALFKRFRIPWTVALILGGMALGPYGLKLFQLNDIIQFLSEVGVIFLMFIAGMETRLSAIKSVLKESIVVAVFTGIIPAILGIAIGLSFGYDLLTTILLGIILINTSFAVVVPALESRNMLHTRIGKVIVASTMFQDIASLIAFAIFLQFLTPERWLPLPLVAALLVGALTLGIAFKQLLPGLQKSFKTFEDKETKEHAIFEQELRLVVAVLIGTAIVFEFFKFESIVGAFFAGLILAEITQSKILQTKIHILGYGIFIPIFFVAVGAWTNIPLLFETSTILPLVAAIVIGSSIAKFASGFISGKIMGFSSYESSLIGITSVPQLITTLALAMVSQRLGLLPSEIITAIIILSVVTVIISPTITNRLLDYGGNKKLNKIEIQDTGQTNERKK